MVRKPPPISHDVSVETNGTTHNGRYTVESGVVTVTYGFYHKATQVGESSSDRIARMLLRELVAEHPREGYIRPRLRVRFL
jgi:hypothetical protein